MEAASLALTVMAGLALAQVNSSWPSVQIARPEIVLVGDGLDGKTIEQKLDTKWPAEHAPKTLPHTVFLIFQQPPRGDERAQKDTLQPFIVALAREGIAKTEATSIWYATVGLPGPLDVSPPSCGTFLPRPWLSVIVTDTSARALPCVEDAIGRLGP
jgi:hypothetical protein